MIMTIRELLQNKSPRDRSRAKVKEIAKLNHAGRYAKSNMEIEILALSAVEINGQSGVEVLVRAWENGRQLGFGKDGSVEIERIRIFNPPILIQDENGPIVRTWSERLPVPETVDKSGWKDVLRTRRFRDDPLEAIRVDVAHTISIIGKVGARVKVGKTGNTTSTFHPDADPESTSVDGFTFSDPASATSWSNIHDSLENDARTSGNDSATSSVNASILRNMSGQWKNIGRSIFLFDTSAIPDGATIDSATLSIYQSGKDQVGGDFSPGWSVGITSSNPASNTAIVKADYAIAVYGTTDFATRKAYSGISNDAYNDFALNAFGIANISKTGISKFAARVGADIDNSAPSGNDRYSYAAWYFAEQDGTSTDPKLVVEHTSTGPAHIKKISGVTSANVKKIAGVPIASVKKVVGVA